MARRLGSLAEGGIERSCRRREDRIRFGSGAVGLERAEVYLAQRAFEPHRHDTYALGLTLAGVQTFRYRGRRHVSLPGQLALLHPDEAHDGAAATADGFGYRVLYVAPELVREAIEDGTLPFVAEPVRDVTPVTRPIAEAMADLDTPMSELRAVEIAAAVTDVLRSLDGRRDRLAGPSDMRALTLVRDHLAAHSREQTSAWELEALSGLDRYTIARQFRRAFGTSPDRYRTLRRLGLARAAIERGEPLVRAAVDSGFADQSHMTRQFVRTYGFTPARWRALTARRVV